MGSEYISLQYLMLCINNMPFNAIQAAFTPCGLATLHGAIDFGCCLTVMIIAISFRTRWATCILLYCDYHRTWDMITLSVLVTGSEPTVFTTASDSKSAHNLGMECNDTCYLLLRISLYIYISDIVANYTTRCRENQHMDRCDTSGDTQSPAQYSKWYVKAIVFVNQLCWCWRRNIPGLSSIACLLMPWLLKSP